MSCPKPNARMKAESVHWSSAGGEPSTWAINGNAGKLESMESGGSIVNEPSMTRNQGPLVRASIVFTSTVTRRLGEEFQRITRTA
jgi:hypothetical protein